MSANQPPPGGGKVPLVSEVVDRLSKALGPSAPKRAAMFQAALQVCSDELRRVKKEGGEPASLQELVKRASEILGSPIGKPPDVGAAFQGDLSPLLDQTFGPMADKSEETPSSASGPSAPDLSAAFSEPERDAPAPPPTGSNEPEPFFFESVSEGSGIGRPRPTPGRAAERAPEFSTVFPRDTDAGIYVDETPRRRRPSILTLAVLFGIVGLGSVAGFFLLGPLVGLGGDTTSAQPTSPPQTPTPRYRTMFEPTTPPGSPRPAPTSPVETPLAAPTEAAAVTALPTPTLIPALPRPATPVARPTQPPVPSRGSSQRPPDDASVMITPDWGNRPAAYAIATRPTVTLSA
jgi:hypothetical protein